jgi:DNA-binding transcriptional regulator YiaG
MAATPAEVILDKFDMSPPEFAEVLGYSRTIWHQWMKRGGKIPQPAQDLILKLAAEKGVHISARDLIFGRT